MNGQLPDDQLSVTNGGCDANFNTGFRGAQSRYD